MYKMLAIEQNFKNNIMSPGGIKLAASSYKS